MRGSGNKLSDLEARADTVWGPRPNPNAKLSGLLGSSESDEAGQEYWESLFRTSFVAPNFYFEDECPQVLKTSHSLQVGQDRDDRPLYYFLADGSYSISSDSGLLMVARSSEELFTAFITYAEWIDDIILLHGTSAIVDSQFSEKDLVVLQETMENIFHEDFKSSFWAEEVKRNRNLVTR